MNRLPLHKKLADYCASDILPMHMPGGKRRTGSLSGNDITEISGFDDLHSPLGVIKDLEEDLASLWHADEAILSVNGATAMIISAICAAMRYCPEDRVLAASNCHLSVWHGIEVSGCMHKFVYPAYGSLPFALEVRPEDVERALEEDPGIKAVVITSPTYEGILSDTHRIHEITRKHGCTLIVDSAHGAHMGLDPFWGPDAEGDIVIKSCHKTLSSPTQTAVLLRYSDRVKMKDIRHYVDITESSSPSYLLMSGMSEMAELLKSQEPMKQWKEAVTYAEEQLAGLQNIKLFGYPHKDPSKIVLLCDGKKTSRILREEYGIEVEASFDTHLTAMTGIGDDLSSISRFTDAVIRTDIEHPELKCSNVENKDITHDTVMSLAESARCRSENVTVSDAEGRISAEFIYKYPPGIPVILPGDRLRCGILKDLDRQEICCIAGRGGNT